MEEIRRRLAEAIQRALSEATGETPELPRVEDPPRPEMGDLASPAVLQAAKRLGRNPRELAEQVVGILAAEEVPGVHSWSIAGPGFLNANLDRGAFLAALVANVGAGAADPRADKVLVEHTSINPNKAAHIGHLRNACMGDTLVRLFRRLGHPVEVHNYIDDTGVQVADVVIGFLDLRGMSPAEVAELTEPFDYACWDLYTDVSERLRTDASLQDRRREVLEALEKHSGVEAGMGGGVEAAMGRVVARRIVERHVRTMARLGIHYDVLVQEGDILALDLWAEAFERLKVSPDVHLSTEGKHAGCWVMSLAGTAGFEDMEEADKVLVRSNGVATYVAKDIAYHLWKYGLLDRDFTYEAVPSEPGGLWRTTNDGGEPKPFGHADRAITVIDVRQSYLQAVVARAFDVIGEQERGATLTHFAYEMVALSPLTAAELGIPVDDGEDRQFIEMSGRRGYGVKADDLLDELIRRATREVAERNPELSESARRSIGEQIAVGAVRYFLLRFTRNTVIVFDLDEALSFEGETGPYIQYASVRAAHIFDKLGDRLGIDVASAVGNAMRGTPQPEMPIDLEAVGARLAADDGHLWSLVLALGRYEEIIEQTSRSLELSTVAKYAFTLAQQFSRFYHAYPILQAETDEDRVLRVLVAYSFQRRLADVLELLGIPLPERM